MPYEPGLTAGLLQDTDGVRIGECGVAVEHFHTSLTHARFRLAAHRIPHIDFVARQIGDRGLAPQRQVHAEQLARPPTGDEQRAFAQCFAGNRAGIEARAADVRFPFDQRHAFAKSGRRQRATYARRAAADHNEVVGSLVHRHRVKISYNDDGSIGSSGKSLEERALRGRYGFREVILPTEEALS